MTGSAGRADRFSEVSFFLLREGAGRETREIPLRAEAGGFIFCVIGFGAGAFMLKTSES